MVPLRVEIEIRRGLPDFCRMMRAALLVALLPGVFSTPTITSSLTNLTTPYAWTDVSWAGVPRPSSADWLAVFCTGGTYYWWIYATGAAAGTLPMRLFANSPGSGCETLTVSYYSGSSVLMSSAPIPIAPMIQQVHLSLTSDPTVLVVDFVSSANGATPACRYGDSPGALTRAAPAQSSAVKTIGTVAHAVLRGLVPGQRVFYACGDGVATSAVFNATAGAGAAARVAVWADFGVK